jgi:hypothetical protein
MARVLGILVSALRPTELPIRYISGTLYMEVKWDDYLLPSSSEFMDAHSFTATPPTPYTFIARF